MFWIYSYKSGYCDVGLYHVVDRKVSMVNVCSAGYIYFLFLREGVSFKLNEFVYVKKVKVSQVSLKHTVCPQIKSNFICHIHMVSRC
jgi:hypothetical protein